MAVHYNAWCFDIACILDTHVEYLRVYNKAERPDVSCVRHPSIVQFRPNIANTSFHPFLATNEHLVFLYRNLRKFSAHFISAMNLTYGKALFAIAVGVFAAGVQGQGMLARILVNGSRQSMVRMRQLQVVLVKLPEW